ncbi:MAG: hypothetical protein ABI120_14160 [Gemmatimonadaceae bacterium]
MRTPEQDADVYMERREVSLVSLLTLLLRRRALIVWSAIICAVLFTGLALLGDRTWSTGVSFFPQGKKTAGSLSALAAQFGVPVGSGDANESPNFYADLVKSRAILGVVVDSGVTVQPGNTHVDIATAYKIKVTEPALRREKTIEKLAGSINVSTNVKTGIVNMRVSSNAPDVSMSISNRLLELLNRFNQDTRRGQASAERKFTEERLAVVKIDLRVSEDKLQNFLDVNRVAQSAQLKAQQDRLDRDVRLQQELYTNLAKAFEQAKIDEVRDTPVITVIERPEMAARPDTRGIASKGVASLVAGFILGAIVALMIEGLSRNASARTPEDDEFHRLAGATLRDLRRPWRLLASVKA